jgi:hypothetical protein
VSDGIDYGGIVGVFGSAYATATANANESEIAI